MVLLLSLLLLPVSLLRFLSLRSKQRTEGEEGSEEPTVNGVRNRSLENAPPLALISSKNPVETGSRGEPKIEVGARSRLATTKKNSKWPPCVACRAVKKMWQLRCTATKRRQKSTPVNVTVARARYVPPCLPLPGWTPSFWQPWAGCGSWTRRPSSAAWRICSRTWRPSSA